MSLLNRNRVALGGLAFLIALVAGVVIRQKLQDESDSTRERLGAREQAESSAVASETTRNHPSQRHVVPVTDDSEPSETSGQEPPRAMTKREYLASFWGSRWSAIEERVEQQVPDLDSEIDPSTIAPWDEVEAELREAVLGGGLDKLVEQWESVVPEALDDAQLESPSFNKDGKTLSEADLQRMRDIAEQFAPSIRSAVERLAKEEERLRAALWRDRRVGLGPLHPIWDSDPGPTAGPAISSSVKGWALDARLDSDSDPLYGSAMDALWEIRNLRRRELLNYTASL